MISNAIIEQASYEIMKQAAIDIPDDYLNGIKSVAEKESEELSGFVIKTMVSNYEAATGDRRPMCADTGLPRYYVKVGDKATFDGGFTGIERAMRSATARATNVTCRCDPIGFIRCGEPSTIIMWESTLRKLSGHLNLMLTG